MKSTAFYYLVCLKSSREFLGDNPLLHLQDAGVWVEIFVVGKSRAFSIVVLAFKKYLLNSVFIQWSHAPVYHNKTLMPTTSPVNSHCET